MTCRTNMFFIRCSANQLFPSSSLSFHLRYSCGLAVMSLLWQWPCFFTCLCVPMATSIPHLHPLLSNSECFVRSSHTDLTSFFLVRLSLEAPVQRVMIGCKLVGHERKTENSLVLGLNKQNLLWDAKDSKDKPERESWDQIPTMWQQQVIRNSLGLLSTTVLV